MLPGSDSYRVADLFVPDSTHLTLLHDTFAGVTTKAPFSVVTELVTWVPNILNGVIGQLNGYVSAGTCTNRNCFGTVPVRSNDTSSTPRTLWTASTA